MIVVRKEEVIIIIIIERGPRTRALPEDTDRNWGIIINNN